MANSSFVGMTDDQVINFLYESYYQTLFNYALRKLSGDNDAADECVHFVFDTARAKIKALRFHPNIGGWMFNTLHNRILAKYHEEQIRRHRFVTLTAKLAATLSYEMNFNTEKEIDDATLITMKDALLNELTPSEYELYRLFYIEKESIVNISQLLGLSVGAVKMRLFRLREKIKEKAKKFF